MSDEASGIWRLKKILDKVAWAMKKCDHNTIGETLFKHCEKNKRRIFDYFMDENHNDEKAIKEKMTAAVDASLLRIGMNIRFHCHLNQFMVDYSIIPVLRNNMGYSSWSELTDLECGICFKNYSNRKKALPDWNIEEESFNNY